MKSDEPRTRYQSPLREQQKYQTRDLILDAAERVLGRANANKMTIADVARAARVTERTVYRHFPTRGDLIAACWRRVLRSIPRGKRNWEVDTLEQMLDLTREAMKAYSAHEGVVQALADSPTGREIRKGPGLQILERLRGSCERILPDHSPDTIREIAAATYTIASVPSWAHLRFQFDLSDEQSISVILHAIQWMVEGARIKAKKTQKPDSKAVRRRGG